MLRGAAQKFGLLLLACRIGDTSAAAFVQPQPATGKQFLPELCRSAIVREELLEAEVALFQRGENPITTLTWFQGNHQKAGTILKRRLARILQLNPWLGGKLVQERNGKVFLEYDNNSQTLQVQNFLTLLDSDASTTTSPISRTTRLEQLARKCRDYILTRNVNDRDEFCKISAVPCRLQPHKYFALIVSMSHLVMDGHTYYNLLHMLCSTDNNDSIFVPLIVKRVRNSAKLQAQAMGQENSLVANPELPLLLNLGMGMVRGSTVGPANQGVYALVDNASMTIEKIKAAAAESVGVDFCSTNDVLTSWFVQNIHPQAVGLMAINWRNRLPGHTGQHAGNYENVLLYGRSDSATPGRIRQSLQSYRRTETIHDPSPSFWSKATTPFALVTNWSSFSGSSTNTTNALVIDGCREELHIPLYDPVSLVPTASAVMIIFRAGPKGVGVFMVSSPDNLRRLGYGRQFNKRASFLSTESLL